MSSGLENSTVTRLYRCHNEACQCEIVYTQKLKDNFKKKCPICKKRTLYITSGKLNMNIMFDLKTPKTLGSLSDQNIEKDLKETGKIKTARSKPWYRKKHKIDYSILKDPVGYISGEKK